MNSFFLICYEISYRLRREMIMTDKRLIINSMHYYNPRHPVLAVPNVVPCKTCSVLLWHEQSKVDNFSFDILTFRGHKDTNKQ